MNIVTSCFNVKASWVNNTIVAIKLAEIINDATTWLLVKCKIKWWVWLLSGLKGLFLFQTRLKNTLPESIIGIIKMHREAKAIRDLSGRKSDIITDSLVIKYMVNRKKIKPKNREPVSPINTLFFCGILKRKKANKQPIKITQKDKNK